MAVPVSALPVNPSSAGPSNKGYERYELDDIMSRVPDVYKSLDAGTAPVQLLAARASADPRERQLGEVYANLFGRSPSAQPLAAEWDGGAFDVTKGHHRIEAARRLGLPVVPVVISARTEAELASLEARFVGAVGPSYSRYRSVHDTERRQDGPLPVYEPIRERGDA